MNQLSASFMRFDQAVAKEPSITCTEAYQESASRSLLETSCFVLGTRA